MDALVSVLRDADFWWVYPVGALMVTVSALLPPVPSTTLFVALGSLSMKSEQLDPYLLALSMLLGAVAGDAATFVLVRRFRPGSRRWFAGSRWRSTVGAARARLDGNGLTLVMVSRFVPLGRLTLNVAAASVPQPARAFVAHSAAAGVLWSAYSVGIGTVTGLWPQLSTELAVLLAIAVSVLLGRAITLLIAWNDGREAPLFARRDGGA